MQESRPFRGFSYSAGSLTTTSEEEDPPRSTSFFQNNLFLFRQFFFLIFFGANSSRNAILTLLDVNLVTQFARKSGWARARANRKKEGFPRVTVSMGSGRLRVARGGCGAKDPPLAARPKFFEGGPLPLGSWSGNLPNRRTPRGGGFVRQLMFQDKCV